MLSLLYQNPSCSANNQVNNNNNRNSSSFTSSIDEFYPKMNSISNNDESTIIYCIKNSSKKGL